MSGGHKHDPGHKQEHSDDARTYKTRFHDPQHAADFDRRTSEIRADLAEKLADMLTLAGDERILDVATGTGRIARPVAKRLKGGGVVGIDEAPAMLDVGHRHEEAIPGYTQCAGAADALPFAARSFDRAFVSFSIHHFGSPEGVVREVLRVLRNGGKFVVLEPVLKEPRDTIDAALEAAVNRVFRRTHGDAFRFQTASGLPRLLLKTGYRIGRATVATYSFHQQGMEGIPMGAHWLEVADELAAGPAEVRDRLQQSYFTSHQHGEAVHVSGTFAYGLIRAEKPE
jgi:ubiquinone/menaquinone biosynthesis C-methylase UbiE